MASTELMVRHALSLAFALCERRTVRCCSAAAGPGRARGNSEVRASVGRCTMLVSDGHAHSGGPPQLAYIGV